MIDSRNISSYQRRRREWLIRNPVLSQSCPMDANEAEWPIHSRAVEEADRISPNFLELDQLNDFTNPFGLDLNDLGKSTFPASNTDVMNNENDNAVDPNLYINKSSDSTSPLSGLSPIAVASPNIQLPDWQQTGPLATPSSAFARQQSVNFVMEVLAACPVDNAPHSCIGDPNYPLTPSPELGDEDLMIDHPSECFILQEAQRTRTVSEHAPFLPHLHEDQSRSRAFSFDHALFLRDTNVVDSFPARSIQTTGNEAGSNKVNETTANTTSCNDSANVSTDDNETAPVLESLPSIVKTSLQNPPKIISEDSLDFAGMMADFIESTNTVHEETRTSPVSPQHPVVDLTQEKPCTSDYAPKMVRTASYKKRRDQNNKSCRESRKKRKVKQCETERKAKELELENEELELEIVRLKEEVEEVRVQVLQQMSSRSKR